MDKLVLLNANGQNTDFSLHGQEIAIGRGPECAVRLSDTNVSRLHAKVVREGANWTVVDAQSRYGTKVNGDKKTSHTLKIGDIIEVGSTKLRFDSAASGTGFVPADSMSQTRPAE